MVWKDPATTTSSVGVAGAGRGCGTIATVLKKSPRSLPSLKNRVVGTPATRTNVRFAAVGASVW